MSVVDPATFKDGINVLVQIDRQSGGEVLLDECYTFIGSESHTDAERLEGIACELRRFADRLDRLAAR